MFKNDERYWDINLLNKWFAISSIVFLLVLVWIFIDNNDDEFKEYQKEFRKLQIEIAETKLNEEKSLVEGKSEDYELELARAVKLYDDKSEKVKSINSELGVLRAGFYKVNLQLAISLEIITYGKRKMVIFRQIIIHHFLEDLLGKKMKTLTNTIYIIFQKSSLI